MADKKRAAELSDEELMARFKGGEESAFSALYDRYQHRLYGYCVKMLKDRTHAEDIFQEVFIRIAQKKQQFSGGNFGGWLFKIARNQCLNAIRDRHEHTSIDEIGQTIVAPEVELYDEKSELLRKAIDKLPDDYREALVLRVYSGFSYKEISDLTEVKLATVKVRIHRAKLKLHELLEPYFSGQFDG